jgi:hypothetical protein
MRGMGVQRCSFACVRATSRVTLMLWPAPAAPRHSMLPGRPPVGHVVRLLRQARRAHHVSGWTAVTMKLLWVACSCLLAAKAHGSLLLLALTGMTPSLLCMVEGREAARSWRRCASRTVSADLMVVRRKGCNAAPRLCTEGPASSCIYKCTAALATPQACKRGGSGAAAARAGCPRTRPPPPAHPAPCRAPKQAAGAALARSLQRPHRARRRTLLGL